MSSQNIKIKPRPRSQSLLRTLGCLGGFCALLLSAFFVLGVMVYRLQSEELSIETIPPEDISSMDKNKIVQPLFINETRFDVLAAIWSPAPTNGSEASDWDEEGKKDHVYWKGILQENITFTDGNEKNVSLPMDLDLSFLWLVSNGAFLSVSLILDRDWSLDFEHKTLSAGLFPIPTGTLSEHRSMLFLGWKAQLWSFQRTPSSCSTEPARFWEKNFRWISALYRPKRSVPISVTIGGIRFWERDWEVLFPPTLFHYFWSFNQKWIKKRRS